MSKSSKITKIKNGSKYEMNGWVRVSIRGNAFERGKSHGFLLAKEIKEVFKMLDFNLMNNYGYNREFFSETISELFKNQIKERYSEFFEEMQGIVVGANKGGTQVSLNDIILWNCYYSLDYMIGSFNTLINDNNILRKKYGHLFKDNKLSIIKTSEGGAKEKCTAFIAVGNYTKDGKIVCGHNTFDDFLNSQYSNIMLYIKPIKGHSFIMQTSPGCISSGSDFYVNSNGLICTETTIGGFQKFILKDPICCRIRKTIQYSNNFDDCIKFLKDGNGGDYANTWFFGDIKTNTIMSVELGLEYININKKKNGYFIGYNAPIDPQIRNLECINTGYNDIRRHQGARRVRLTQLMEENKGKLDVIIGQKILADHYDVYLNKINPCSRTCCSHYELDDRAFMSQVGRPLPYQPRGALDGIVCDSKLAKNIGLIARWGTSCGTPFNANEFCKRNIQWAEQKPYLIDRPHQPWTEFTIKKSIKRETKRKKSIKTKYTLKNKYK